MTDRGIWLADAAQRENLGAFVQRALRLDEAAVIRLRARGEDALVAWAATGFEVLACRVVGGRVQPADLCAGADTLSRALVGNGRVDPGFSMDSVWRGALPPDSGFVHLDDVPARAMLDLAQRGADLVREHSGAQGPPPSLLDQEVLTVSTADGDAVGVPMRCVFALTAMGFIPDPVPDDEVVRVRAHSAWLRIDARFGSVYRRRGGPMRLLL